MADTKTTNTKKEFEVTPVIEEFLCEFSSNTARRKVLLDALQNKTPVEGGKYFQSRFTKVQGA